jgi:hypothetical protein
MKKSNVVHEFYCDGCGRTTRSTDFYSAPNWIFTADGKHLCQHCKRLRGKRPRNLSPKELERALFGFPQKLRR